MTTKSDLSAAVTSHLGGGGGRLRRRVAAILACALVAGLLVTVTNLSAIPAAASSIPWSVDATPGLGQLVAVSCVTTTDCWGVGSTANSNAPSSTTLAEHWDGSSWSQVTTPYDASGTGTLNGVSCVSTSDCMAVGTWSKATVGSVAMLWNGSAWTDEPLAATGDNPDVMTAVTWPSATNCWA